MAVQRGSQRFRAPPENSFFLAELIEDGDPRSNSPEMAKTKLSEIKNLLERENFKIFLREDIPYDDHVLPGLFALTIKHVEDGEKKSSRLAS